ncbi:ComC/BlpC family leader-containing pheromone/bacteriocin [Enterobacter kobei]|nr:ComC/BlpC family leader-containing pheromone/bacteriocin [Enterobacter kobei]HBL7322623.1 ComC/BlpC family leader-containing pheromone/bacteriocin [Enterobacter kobei]HCR1838979.1 ComC/BlpC family leader-containing pheromone/bacteriocin [Enterobacter kobei]HCR1915675.1 ComC/BlpC family leader-containing pheromone/bacteriocin [Enterobacter kobei]HCR1917634.1 ComC/BlpC family leader-containing pheromone/bacteriocin [Enterobacter kobei]
MLPGLIKNINKFVTIKTKHLNIIML